MSPKNQPTPLQKSDKVELNRKQSKKSWKQNMNVIFAVFFTGICLSLYLQRIICQNLPYLSQLVFGFSNITHNFQRLNILKQTLLYISILQFIISIAIMNLRIFGGKIRPVAQKDPLSISLLNRILSNNIQQSFVFFGLYSYLLLSTQTNLETQYVFALPLIFVIGRVLFCLAYILATITGIVTLRSFGFAFAVSINFFIILELILNFSDVYGTFLFA